MGIRRFKADVVRDLGGDPSAQQLAVLEVAARTKVMLDAVDDWLLRQPSLVVGKKRSLIPALAQRQQLADSFTRHMQALGLEPAVTEMKAEEAAISSCSKMTPGDVEG